MSSEVARAELHAELTEHSERALCAGWYGDLEYIVWDRIGRGESRLGNVTLSEAYLARLLALSQRAGGWFHWSDEAEAATGDGLVLVSQDVWATMYAAWLERVPPPMRPRDR